MNATVQVYAGNDDGEQALFIPRLAPTFETQPLNERLYEVVTRDGERIASTTSYDRALELANNLIFEARKWQNTVGDDAVLG